jgi:2',3'-cyclic-nucleotide 2'-phosphodiesterase (5'-nucleotidase family)
MAASHSPGAGLLLALVLASVLPSCTSRPTGPTASPPPPKSATAASAETPARAPVVLSIVGTNDLHGHIERLPAFSAYVTRLRELRSHDGGLVLVDAGDLFQGTLESNGSEGRSVIEAYDLLGYTAVAIGNHDFDYGPVGDVEPGSDPGVDRRGALRARLHEARFPFLSANLREGSSAPRWERLSNDPVLVDIAGVKVGIVGGLTEETPAIVMRAYFEGLGVAPLAPSLSAQAKQARDRGARVVVAAVHAGGKCADVHDPKDASSCDPSQEIMRVAEHLAPGLVDVIVAGHTHKAMAQSIAGIAVVEGWALGTHFSRVDVTVPPAADAPLAVHIFPPTRVCATDAGECVPTRYEGRDLVADTTLATKLEPYRRAARTLRERELGVEITSIIRPEHGIESPLGNLLSDLLLEAVPGADVSLLNGGGLRAPFRAGRLTYGDLYETQPFDNRVATFTLTGAELRRVVESHLAKGQHGILSVGGLRVEARCDASGLRVTLLRKGKPVGDDARLKIVTSDYLATGGDELFVPIELKSDVLDIRTETVRDALGRALEKRGGKLSGTDRKLFDPKHPRLDLPSARPVSCGAKG